MTSINVAVVDDGSVVIRGAVDVLRGWASCSFLGAYPAAEQIRMVMDSPEQVVLLIDPFVSSGVSTAAISTMPPQVALLIMSACTDQEAIRQALQAGARGYIGKDSDVSTLLAAVGAVGVGGMYLAGLASEVLMRPSGSLKAEGSVPFTGLTPRERDVLVMVANGLTHKQIGSRLNLAKATVDTYVHRIRQKVGAVNKAGLTRVAMHLDLLGEAG